ncbi:MAG: class I SAM-dependent methyltransferase [Planctomycetes bacterium]|nr:class I SAM-dependent methyltransferase [Planctomycetota bacterium]
MNNEQSHEWKTAAISHFQRWSHHYDRDIINILLFRPCYRRVMIQLRHWIRRGASSLRVLDVGCGTGNLIIQTLQLGSELKHAAGLDMSDNMIDYAREKTRDLKLEKRISFHVGDAEHLPFKDNAFDVVTCCNSFHHYPYQDRAVGEMHRVLDRNGRLILIDGYRDDPIGFFIFDICVERVEKHVHHCSAERFGMLLREAGMKEIKQQVFGICPPAIMNIAVADK